MYVDDGKFQIELKEGETVEEALSERFIYVLRTEDGNIRNERRYLLPPTPLSKFLLEVNGEEDFMDCELDGWRSSIVHDNHFSLT